MADPESESEKLIASLFAEKERAAGAPIATATPEPTSEPTSQEIIAGLFANKDASTEVSTDSQKIIAEAFANKAVSQVPQVPEVPQVPQVPQVPADIEVAPPQVTEEATRRKSQAELIEEYEARRAPAPGSVFEGREPLPFEERPPDRDPLGRAGMLYRIPARVGAAYTSELIGLQRALAEQLGIHGRIVDPLDISPDTAIQRLYRGEAGANPGLRELVDAINQRASERNFGQNLLLEVGSDPLNLIPGVGFTQLGRRGLGMSGPRNFVDDVTIGRASNLISEAPPSIQRQIALRDAVQNVQNVGLDARGIPTRTEGVASAINTRAQLALPPGRTQVPDDLSFVLLTNDNPSGIRVHFATVAEKEKAWAELGPLGGRGNEVQVLPGNATAADVKRVSELLPREVPVGGEVRTAVTRRSGGKDVTPRTTQTQFIGRLNTEGTRELRLKLRNIQAKIARMTVEVESLTGVSRANARRQIANPDISNPKNSRSYIMAKHLEDAASLEKQIADIATPPSRPLEQTGSMRGGLFEGFSQKAKISELDLPGAIGWEPFKETPPIPVVRKTGQAGASPRVMGKSVTTDATQFPQGIQSKTPSTTHSWRSMSEFEYNKMAQGENFGREFQAGPDGELIPDYLAYWSDSPGGAGWGGGLEEAGTLQSGIRPDAPMYLVEVEIPHRVWQGERLPSGQRPVRDMVPTISREGTAADIRAVWKNEGQGWKRQELPPQSSMPKAPETVNSGRYPFSEQFIRPSQIPYEASTPEAVARLRAQVRQANQAKNAQIDSAIPDGSKSPPVTDEVTVPPAGSSHMPSVENRLLRKSIAAQQSDERLDQTILGLHEAAIAEAIQEADGVVVRGNQLLQSANIGVRRGNTIAAREEDIPILDHLYNALHNPSKVASGEIKLANRVKELFENLRQEMDFESALRIDFEPNMATRDDYFYRGWKPPKGMFESRRGRLVTKPGFKKPRNGATYQEMRELGFEPLFWNPYEQLRVAKLQGIRFREQTELVEALKTLGDDMIKPHQTGPLEVGWRVPEVGPAFEGKPIAFRNKATGELQQATVGRWQVRTEMANPLENMYGKKPKGLEVSVGGRDFNLIKYIDWLTFMPKRAKLFGSFFQQSDFLTRSGIGSWHGMVNAMRKGHPFEAVSHLAHYPMTVKDILHANFSPGKRLSLMEQLKSTKPIVEGRPGINLQEISRSGLGLTDVTIFDGAVDDIVRDVATEVGWVKKGKAIPRALIALEGSMRRGLFDGVYRAAIINDIRHNIAPVMARTYPNDTDAQIARRIAIAANKRFSTIPASQSVIQDRTIRETGKRLFFSINESEGLLRQAAGLIPGKSYIGLEGSINKAFWLENWLGTWLFMITTAEIIHFASTGKYLPFDRFSPIASTEYGPSPIGYNRDFASPDLPFRGTGDNKIQLDIAGQMDTAFRVLDPEGFVEGRFSVPIRAGINQKTGENFYGNDITTLGPGGVASRTAQLAQDLGAPIGFGQSSMELLRPNLPEGLVAETESRIGLVGQLIQATGQNVRSELLDDQLKRENPDWRNWSDAIYEKEKKNLIVRLFGEQTEREKELRKKEIEELLGGNKEEKADKFFGR